MYRPMESAKIKDIHENIQKYSKIPLMLAASLKWWKWYLLRWNILFKTNGRCGDKQSKASI